MSSFIILHHNYNIKFVSQGAHWRTDAHNGNNQNSLWSAQTISGVMGVSVCTSAACVPFFMGEQSAL